MIKFINKYSGGDMYVHESRVEEYLAAGHRLASPPTPDHPLIRDEKPERPAKKSTKKR